MATGTCGGVRRAAAVLLSLALSVGSTPAMAFAAEADDAQTSNQELVVAQDADSGSDDSGDSSPTDASGDETTTTDEESTETTESTGIEWEEWTSDSSLPSTEGNYVLTKNVKLGSAWVAPSGVTRLKLDGYAIQYTGSAEEAVINIPTAAELEVWDAENKKNEPVASTRTHKFAVDDTTGVWFKRDNGTNTVTGGVITGGKEGGVLVYGAFSLFGGTIVGNTSPDNGGGVYVDNGGTFNMTGGIIAQNESDDDGAGVYVRSNGKFAVAGTVRVVDNHKGEGDKATNNNVFLESGATITVGVGDVKLSGASVIGVSVESGDSVTDQDLIPVTKNLKGNGNRNSFVSDDTSLGITLEDNEAVITTAYTLTYHANFDGADPATVTRSVAKRDAVALIECPWTREAYVFDHWSTSTGDTDSYEAGEYMTITANTDVYAIWKTAEETAGTITTSIKGVNADSPELSSSNLGNVAETLVTAEEKATGVEVYLQYKSLASSEVPATDLSLLITEAAKVSAVPGAYFDLTLWKKVGDSDPVQLTETSTPVQLTVKVPELPAIPTGYARTYYLFRAHDGAATLLTTSTTTPINASSDKFSTFLIAYKDDPVSTPGTGGNTNTDTTNSSNRGTAATTAATRTSTPSTGDNSMSPIVVAVVAVAAVAVAGFGIYLRRQQ